MSFNQKLVTFRVYANLPEGNYLIYYNWLVVSTPSEKY